MKDFKLNEYEYERNRPIGIRFKDDYVWVTLQDGRTIGNPLEWHPWLAKSPAEKLVNVEMSVFSIYWPDLDEGLDVEGMLRGTAHSRIQKLAKSDHG